MSNRNGVREWVFQRVSNALIIVFAVVYLAMFLSLDSVNPISWADMHASVMFKAFASVVLVFAMLNSLLAGWQIGSDYIQKVPFGGFGPIFTAVYVLGSAAMLVYGMMIIWS